MGPPFGDCVLGPEGQSTKEPTAPMLDRVPHGLGQGDTAAVFIHEGPLRKASFEPAQMESLLRGRHWSPTLGLRLVPGLDQSFVIPCLCSKEFPDKEPSPHSKVTNRISTPRQVLCREEQPRQCPRAPFPCRKHGPSAQPGRRSGVSGCHTGPVCAGGHSAAAEKLPSTL